jgi:hypothetical protein
MSQTHSSSQKPNKLIDSTSPYLLQHAYNPVEWYPWGEEALQKALTEDKPIIVSIGYSACHWCHVMERESFESEEIAAVMNEHFVNIKVDREERPDVDAVYMDAVQAMGVRGGWPLNAFLMPDAKPFYAGTYFPAQNWTGLLQKISDIFQQNRSELAESATQFQKVISASELKKYGLNPENTEFKTENLDVMYLEIAQSFDAERGGMQKAPKFPMPSIYQFLLHYSQTTENAQNAKSAQIHLEKTLDEMAYGGIYDQIGGGFARYSVDAEWLAPHFEKMLYDNAQLISLYSDAYNLSKKSLYKEVVYQSIQFVADELMSEEGGFYAALDADSEGVEGKYYTWTAEEINQIFKDENERILFNAYYQVKEEGNWEEGVNILHRRLSDEVFVQARKIDLDTLSEHVKKWKEKLSQVRSKRVRPGLDDKILTGWNALMLKGLCNAYQVFGEDSFLKMAKRNAEFLWQKLWNGKYLYRTYKGGEAKITAYLEDYALLMEAYITLYQITFEIHWLHKADILAQYCFENFYDTEEGFFFFTDAKGEKLIARKKEIFDNVIPASNSVMAKNLFYLGLLTDKARYTETAQTMLASTQKILLQSLEYLTNWGQLYCLFAKPMAEVAFIGEKCTTLGLEFTQKQYFPHKILLGSTTESEELPLLAHKTSIEKQTTIYVCFNKSCQLPVYQVEKAWQQIKGN